MDIVFERRGDGPPLLLMHGIGHRWQAWEPVLDLLAAERDVIAVDLGPVPQAGIGSEVTLWGHGPGGAVLPIDEVAASAGTVGYELMCAVAARVPRVDA